MSTLIVYGTKYGCTSDVARQLAAKIGGDVRVVDLAKEQVDSLSPYTTVIIGSSVYVGQIHKPVKEFCEKHLAALKEKNVGVFTCGANTAQLEAQFTQNFPAELLAVARAAVNLGYTIQMEKMGFIDKMITRTIMKTSKSENHLQPEAMDKLVRALA